jgi:EAL domain-containing protein (putative c-di-GMP-specific phosphodiesterase class I)
VARCLRGMGCDQAQGYLFARPLAPDAFVAWMAQREEVLA